MSWPSNHLERFWFSWGKKALVENSCNNCHFQPIIFFFTTIGELMIMTITIIISVFIIEIDSSYNGNGQTMTKPPCFADGPWWFVTLLVVCEVACFSYYYTSQTRAPWRHCLWLCWTHLVESCGIPSWFRSFSSAVFGCIVLSSPRQYVQLFKSHRVSCRCEA